MDLVNGLWPRPSVERKKMFVASAMRELHKVGLVGMHDAGVVPRDIALYDEMSKTEDWTLRVYAMLECLERNTFCPEEAIKVEHPDGMFTVRSVKLFADGALGSWGSAMLEPYSDRPDTSGSLLVNASTLTSLARSWSAAGYQPTHATSDMAYAASRLGEDRVRTSAYRMRSLLSTGLVLGSDFPVEPPNPFEGVYAAVARRHPRTGKGPEGGWHGEEALSVEEALEGLRGGGSWG
ncbi:hypothetical protein N0V88_002718 [Collariella sp. IMI 366227]|nr:hypothetical protein N0V88_002718 [Collariella sp. IMI 366227]